MQPPPNPYPLGCCRQLLSFAEGGELICLSEGCAFLKYPPKTMTPKLWGVLCQFCSVFCTSICSDLFPKHQL